jgi:eukaryotic-like serine/threonine-protein kinase
MSVPAQSRVAEFRRGNARYVPTARLAAGGMAEVWRGKAEFKDGHIQPIAIKRVLPALASNTLYRRMLEDEARIGMLLRHPNIVRVYDAREVRGSYILIMELVDGPSLRELAQQLRDINVRPSVRASLHIATELARALVYTHEAIDDMGRDLEIVHRDVSPHNVLVSSDGRVKLMDFGLANSSSNLAERDVGMIGGKFGYLSPELVLQQQSSHLLDLFALGVVLWEILTGRRLFQGNDDGETVRNVARCEVPPASSINPEVPGEVDMLLGALLTRDPAHRYQSARNLVADLLYVSSLLGAGDAVRETAALVHTVRARKLPPPRPAVAQTGSISQSRGSITTSGTQVPKVAAALLEELDLLAEPSQLVIPPLPPGARR